MEVYGLKKLSSPYDDDLHEAYPYAIDKVIQKSKNSVSIIKAHESETNKTVAIKLFPRNKRSQPHSAYLNEQQAVAGLSHPHILKYYESYNDAVIKAENGKFTEYSMIVMEFCPFGDLYGMVSKRSFSEKLARTLFRQMVSAISYLHSQDLTHLDLKLENLLVVPTEGVKVIDFESCQRGTNNGHTIHKGTPGYRAPEIVKEKCDNPKAMDIYSLGIILFTIVAGTPPYIETQENDRQKFDKYYEALRKDKRKFWGAHEKYRSADGKENFSKDFKEIVEAMLSADPKKRPTISEIEKFKWYKGEVYDEEIVAKKLGHYFETKK